MELELKPSIKIKWLRLTYRSFLMGCICGGWFAWQSWAAAEDPARLFNDVCSVCHGTGGRGDGPSAMGLHPKPADFTDCKAMAADSDETLFKIIREGGQSVGRSTVMPSWRDSLNDSQIRALVKYIRGFCKK